MSNCRFLRKGVTVLQKTKLQIIVKVCLRNYILKKEKVINLTI